MVSASHKESPWDSLFEHHDQVRRYAAGLTRHICLDGCRSRSLVTVRIRNSINNLWP